MFIRCEPLARRGCPVDLSQKVSRLTTAIRARQAVFGGRYSHQHSQAQSVLTQIGRKH